MRFFNIFLVLHTDPDLLCVFNSHVEESLLKSIITVLGQLHRECGADFYCAFRLKYRGQPWVYSKGLGAKAEEYYVRNNLVHRSPPFLMAQYQEDDLLVPRTTSGSINRLLSSIEPKEGTGVVFLRKKIREALVKLIQEGAPVAAHRTSVNAKLLQELRVELVGFVRIKPDTHWSKVESYTKEECPVFLDAYSRGDLKVVTPSLEIEQN